MTSLKWWVPRAALLICCAGVRGSTAWSVWILEYCCCEQSSLICALTLPMRYIIAFVESSCTLGVDASLFRPVQLEDLQVKDRCCGTLVQLDRSAFVCLPAEEDHAQWRKPVLRVMTFSIKRMIKSSTL